MLNDIALLWRHASPRRRWQFWLVVALMLVGAMAELVTIGAVIPLLVIASDPHRLASLPVVGGAAEHWLQASGIRPIYAAAALLGVSALVATLLRIALNGVSQRFVFAFHRDMVAALYARMLRQPYEWYTRQHSSIMLSAIEKADTMAVAVMAPLLNSFTSLCMALVLGGFMLAIDWAAALIALAVVGSIYGSIMVVSRAKVRSASIREAVLRSSRLRVLQDSLGGIREIILDETEGLFEARMLSLQNELRHISVYANLLSLTPRIVVEGTIIALVAVLALFFDTQPGGIVHALPALGALGLAAQRILPMVQFVYYGAVSYSLKRETVAELAGLLDLPLPAASTGSAAPLPLRHGIQLAHLGFAYDDGHQALANINLTIGKGERIGLIGKSGSGKSTLADVIMGLLAPQDGQLLVDGKPLAPHDMAAWRRQIAHVPQAIFLSDESIAANIAFGHAGHSIDRERAAAAARQAGLGEMLARLPEGLDTMVGERGVRLSGGQRQRIGIARALYKQASVLVLDEATSALDNATEEEVMQAVADLGNDLTVVIIAHRLSTVAGCDRIYRLEHGALVASGSYAQVVG
jgi:ABC-type multidrug transport system fused ATPase/permease subunit